MLELQTENSTTVNDASNSTTSTKAPKIISKSLKSKESFEKRYLNCMEKRNEVILKLAETGSSDTIDKRITQLESKIEGMDAKFDNMYNKFMDFFEKKK